jgi:hypothetical protein
MVLRALELVRLDRRPPDPRSRPCEPTAPSRLATRRESLGQRNQKRESWLRGLTDVRSPAAARDGTTLRPAAARDPLPTAADGR